MLSRKDLILMVVLVVLLVFGAAEVQAQESPGEIPMEELETPTTLNELINKFQKVEYNVIVHAEGEKVQDSLITYQHQGEERIQGVETEILSFSMPASDGQFSDLKVWYGGDEVKQMEVDGEVIPGGMAQNMSEAMLQSVMFPFYNFENFPVEKFEQIGEVSQTRETLFGREVDVFTIEVDEMPEVEIESTVIRLAEFEEFTTVISYDHSSLEEDMEISFTIETLEFR